MKDVVFEKTSLDDLRAFPEEARRDAGRQLDRVQRGKEPFDSKPMTSIGSGVREICITDAAGQFRVIYVAKFEDAIYVLHCFQKKTQKTSLPDVKLARDRYNELEQLQQKWEPVLRPELRENNGIEHVGELKFAGRALVRRLRK